MFKCELPWKHIILHDMMDYWVLPFKILDTLCVQLMVGITATTVKLIIRIQSEYIVMQLCKGYKHSNIYHKCTYWHPVSIPPIHYEATSMHYSHATAALCTCVYLSSTLSFHNQMTSGSLLQFLHPVYLSLHCGSTELPIDGLRREREWVLQVASYLSL